MATANDYFKEVGLPGSATTLASPGYTIGSGTINVGSTANWPTTTGVSFAIDTGTIVVVGGQNTFVRTPGSYTEYDGVVSSGTAVTGLVLRYGTAQNYPAGSTTRVYIPVSSSRENRQVQGLLIAHNQDGTLKQIATGTIADSAVTAAKIADATITNAKLSTATGEPGAWYAYTPTWVSGVTTGNGTWTYGRYNKIGKTVRVQGLFQFGSTSDVTGTLITNYPVPCAAHYQPYQPLGTASYHDNGSVVLLGRVMYAVAGANLIAENTGASFNSRVEWTTVSPFDTAAGDQFLFDYEYEAA